jgi:hypothetical protein
LRSDAFLFYQFIKMKNFKVKLILLQLLASTIVLLGDAKAGSFEFTKPVSELAEERDIEIETIQETDAFPDLITFAIHLYQ